MPISKIKTSSITADAASINLNIDANTLFLDVANNRVGINNTAPATNLAIGSGAGSGGYNGGVYLNRGASSYNFYEANDGTNSIIFGLDHTLSYAKIGSVSSTAISLITGNASRLYITSAGSVGIGTTSPARKLHVQTSGTGAVATLQSDSGPNLAFVGTEASGRTYFIGEGLVTAGNFSVYDGTASAERLVVDSNGNVVIGATPVGGSAKLDVKPSSTYGMWVRTAFADATAYGLEFGLQPSHGSYRSAIRGLSENYGGTDSGALAFYTSNSYNAGSIPERMRIDSSGNTIIGGGATTSSAGFLQINTQVPNTSSSSLGFNSADNAVISSRYNLVFQVDNTNSVAGRGYEWKKGGKGYGDGTSLMSLDSSGNFLVGTTTAIDSSKFQFIGAKAFSSGIPQGQLNIADSTSYSAGAGGAIAFGGKYHSAGFYTTFASIEGVKENATDNHYSGALVFRVRLTGNDNIERMRITSGGEVCIKTTSALNSAPLTIGNGSANDFLAIRGSTGVDGTYVDWLVSAPYGSNSAEQNRIRSSISSNAANSGLQFMISDGAGASTQTQSFRINRTSCTVVGSLSKGSGSFKIDHPLPAKTDTHHLVHSFIEGPKADLIYRGKVNLVAGTATVNIDTVSGMTEGTFVVLCRDVQCFTTNESDWTAVRGSVTGNILTIEAQDNTSTASISWMVIGERKDKHMYDTEWTDDDGKVIVEPLKVQPEEIAPVETE